MNTTTALTIDQAAHAGDIVPRAFVAQGIATRTRRDDVAAVPSAIRSEWIKLRSLRANKVILGMAILAGVLMSWILGAVVKTDPYEHLPFTVANTFMVSTFLTSILAVIAGILLFTSEVQHRTIGLVLAAQPAKWVVVAGKAVVAAAMGLVMGAAGMAAGLAAGAVSGMDVGDTSGMASAAGWALLLTPLAALFGLGVGMIIRHSAAAVSTALVWTFVIENLVRNAAPARVARFLPFSTAGGLLDVRAAGDNAEKLAASLTHAQNGILFAGYSLAALAIGTVLLHRRDAD